MRNGGIKTLAWLQMATGVGIVLFWIGFFTVGLAPENPPPGYFAFEHAFPLPDAFLAAALILAGALLIQGRPAGRVLGLAAAGGLVFLGLVDFSFNLENGMYTLSAADLALNGFINLWCVGLGLVSIRRLGLAERESGKKAS
ncbi:MAG: hypothetical protein AB1896_10590 [Thermodesulfobacteriota bacterium]